MDEIKPPEKMELTSNREVPLALFTFIVRVGSNVIVPYNQNISLVTAYTLEEAMTAVQKQYPAGQPITIDTKGTLPMTAVLDMFNKTINLGGQAPVMPIKQEPEIIARTKKEFYKEIVEGMIKSAESFSSNEIEKNILLKALNQMLELVK